MPQRILYTSHARQRMVLRGISHHEVEEAIRKGSKRMQDGNVVASYLYFEVVYAVRGRVIVVITVQRRW
ncbi:MAG: DUF4258 domain-containing protein [Thermoplasmata archaeon]